MNAKQEFQHAAELMKNYQGYMTAALTGIQKLNEDHNLDGLEFRLGIIEWHPDLEQSEDNIDNLELRPFLNFSLWAQDPELGDEDPEPFFLGCSMIDITMTDHNWLEDLETSDCIGTMAWQIIEQRKQQDAINELMDYNNDNSIN